MFNETHFIQEWVYDVDFENDVRQFPVVDITGIDFENLSWFGIICEGDNDTDQVYIDDVEIRGCIENLIPQTLIEYRDKADISIFPNPTTEGEELILDNRSLSLINHVSIYNLQGQLVNRQALFSDEPQITLSSDQLTAGIYIAKIDTENELVTQRILIME